jgi:hypothetical protein
VAERDSVIADDVDAHGWVLLIDPAAAAAGDHTEALFANQASLFWMISWNCWVRTQPAIARTQNAVIRNTSGFAK